MQKTILITGATDGIGRETARQLASLGHHVLLHGRNPNKLAQTASELAGVPNGGSIETVQADLASLAEVESLADTVAERHHHLDVLVNNAGVFTTAVTTTADGLDVRFVVNTIAPYLLTRRLLPRLGASSRVVNLSSAAQAPVDLAALVGDVALGDGDAYAQSKLALTMWSRSLAAERSGRGPAVIAVNPGSMLGTKMVQQAYGVAGADLGVGADVLRRAALADEFANASGQYFDNDSGRFAPPHPDALDDRKCAAVVRTIDDTLTRLRGS